MAVDATATQSRSFFMRLKIIEADKSNHNHSYLLLRVEKLRENYIALSLCPGKPPSHRSIVSQLGLNLGAMKKLANLTCGVGLIAFSLYFSHPLKN
jgi:hypothetical protein